MFADPPPPYQATAPRGDSAAPPPYFPSPPARLAPLRSTHRATAASGSDSVISFTLNTETVTVDFSASSQFTPNTTLAQYLRTTRWTGTKIACAEGGCGACTVALTYQDNTTGTSVTRAINACLHPLLACNGVAITTNDGIGTPANPHPIQKALAVANGSQCGFCSNGMVMTMYALLSENASPTPLQVEQQYDGNLCRCTGYRQIFHAMKKFSTNGSNGKPAGSGKHGHSHDHSDDLEDCRATGCTRRGIFPEIEEVEALLDAKLDPIVKDYKHVAPTPHRLPAAKVSVNSDGTVWHDCASLADLDFWLPWYTSNGQKPMLVVGQTSLGVYPQVVPVKLYIGNIPDLTVITQDDKGVNIGAACTIYDVLTFLETCTSTPAYRTAHFAQAARHLGRVAGSVVRNAASIAGNIFVAHAHQSPTGFFCSDIATVLMGLGATVHYVNPGTSIIAKVNMTDFFTTDFTGCYAKHIHIPWGVENETFMSYKIALRQVNSHAFVNAAMRIVVDPTTNIVLSQPTIAYGGIFAVPTRITAVETAYVGVDVTDNATFQTLAQSLSTILVPVPYMGHEAFRNSVAVAQFYKFALFIQPSLPSSLQSAVGPWFVRQATTGSTAFTPDPAEYPVDVGMTKIEAIEQTTGYAKYTGDLGVTIGTYFASLVHSDQGNATLTAINTEGAQMLPGFVRFIGAADIPTANNNWLNGPVFHPIGTTLAHAECCVGIVVATTAEYADACASAITCTYSNVVGSNIVTLAAAVAAGSLYPSNIVPPVVKGNATGVIGSTPTTNQYTGTVSIGHQFHFHLENHVAYIVPREDTLECHVATQCPPLVQAQIAASTGLPMSKVIVSTKRCGGGFGGKITNSILPATCGAIAAQLLGRPVQVNVRMQTAMKVLGARGSRQMEYTVAWENDGTITALNATIYCSSGPTPGDAFGGAIVTINNLDNCYKIPNFSALAVLANMNIPSATACRGPGWVPAIQLSEMIISRVARETGLSPEAVREKNFFKRGDTTADGMPLRFWNIPTIWSQLKKSADYDVRRTNVNTFNAGSVWKKRGLAMIPCRFAVGQAGANFDSIVNIYTDGTVSITHGGSEIGQGINTKVIQMVAKMLGMTTAELPLITVNETCTRSLSSANNVTGGSVTSELCGLSAMHACQTLNERLQPYRTKGQTWVELVSAASGAGVQLTATGWTNAPPPAAAAGFNYNSTSAAVVEVEVDCLSGEFEVRRADILFDCGISLNPVIDIGQVQGGFLLGQGYFTQEEIQWDPTTGQCLDATTWHYKPPCAFDVPEVFNVTLLANSPNPIGVLSSKASGEPGTCLGACVTMALQDAVAAFRTAAGDTKSYVCERTPFIVPVIQRALNPQISDFVFS